MSHEHTNNSDDVSRLRHQARLNQLRLKIAKQNEALSTLRRSGHRDTLEGYYDPANYFDPRDYLFETPRFAGAVPSTLNDRDEGRNYPIFRTEQDLALIRGAARWLTASNPIALGVLTSLTNYVIGNGFQYAAAARSTAGKQLAATANDVIDEFLDENDWSGDLDRELFQRSRIDGEYFLGLWHIGGGHVQARTIEPDQVTEPTNKSGLEEWLGCSRRSGLWPDDDAASNANSGQRPDLRADGFVSNWGFGVHTHEVDAQAVHGFYVQWSNRDTDWDYFPGGNEPIVPPGGAGMWLEHAKLNVVRSVKRGLSDFYPIDGNLELARRVLRNMGEGSAVQAAIAWIQEVAPGTTQAQVHSGTLSRADGNYTTLTQQGSRAHTTQHYDPATILKVPSGQKYLPGPLGTQHAPNFITAAEALLRTVALRWNLPENLITGSAANNNFASSLVAETPFVKYAESQQQFYAQRDRKTLWRVLRFAWQAGRFGDVPWNAIKRSLDVTVTPPQVEVRDPEKETRVRQMLNEAGILSRKTWSAQESLDFDQEQKNLGQEAAKEPQDQTKATTPVAATHNAHNVVGDDKPPKDVQSGSGGQHTEEPTESLEAWDATKHPRGGHSENRGWFSKVFGSGGILRRSFGRSRSVGAETATPLTGAIPPGTTENPNRRGASATPEHASAMATSATRVTAAPITYHSQNKQGHPDTNGEPGEATQQAPAKSNQVSANGVKQSTNQAAPTGASTQTSGSTAAVVATDGPNEQDREFAKRAQAKLSPDNYGSKEWFEQIVWYAESPNRRELASSGTGITQEDIDRLDKRDQEIAAHMYRQAWELAGKLLRTGAAPDQKTAIMMAAKLLYEARYNRPSSSGGIRPTNPQTIEQQRYAVYRAKQMLAGQSRLYSFLEDIFLPASVNPVAHNLDNLIAAGAPFANAGMLQGRPNASLPDARGKRSGNKAKPGKPGASGASKPTSQIPSDYINERYKIDMRGAPPGSRTNAAGYARNNDWFWRQMLRLHPQLFSEANKKAIRQGRSPVVDDTWIKYHPSHQSYKRDTLVHHHVDQGAEAVGLPKKIHQKWHGDLHPETGN